MSRGWCLAYCRVSGPNSLFSYNRNIPPPCLPTNPPIVPQCDCLNGASSRICTKPDNQDLAASTLDTSICKPSPSSIGRKRRTSSNSQMPRIHKRSEQSPPNNQWPTKSGITEQNARIVCSSNVSLSNNYRLCIDQLQVNITPIVEICMLDIQVII